MSLVKVVVIDTIKGNTMAVKVMPRAVAINFCAVWEVKHADSDCRISIEDFDPISVPRIDEQ